MTSATDNRTTELLCKLLDERGVKWRAASYPSTLLSSLQLSDTYWQAGNAKWRFTECSDGRKYLSLIGIWPDCTPEQAIAATLGSEREALIRAMEDVLRHATDTVWVSEIETLVDRMVSLGVYGCEVYEGARPWEVDR